MLTFKSLTPADIETCIDIWQDLENHYEHPIGGGWTAEKIAKEMRESEGLAALNDRAEIESYCLFKRYPEHVEILLLATKPRFHRSGAMRALIRSLIDDLGPNDRIWLEVHAGNVPAISLYESLGFELVGERPNYYADGGKAFLYEYTRFA